MPRAGLGGMRERKRNGPGMNAHARKTNAGEYFAALCRLAGDACPRCGAVKYYRLRDGRRRCPDCGYTFHLYTGRWINRGNLSPECWLALLRFFAGGLSVQEAADGLGVKYDTALKAYTAVRLAILSGGFDARGILDQDGGLIGFCPNLENEGAQALCEGCRSYVFSLSLDGASVGMDLANGLAAREVLASPVPRKPWGTLVFTDRHCGRDALVFSCCRKGRELYVRDVPQEAFYLERAGSFKEYADQWFARYRAIRPEAYPLYLAETIFRHNHDPGDLVPLLAGLLCRVVPKHGD